MSKIETVNPATTEKITDYETMTEAEAIEAVEACHAAFLNWREKSHE